MSGLIGKKIGMTSIFDEQGNSVACTLLEVGPCVVTQVKTEEKDGYASYQISFDEKKPKNTTKALQGHFKGAKTSPKHKITEFDSFEEELSLGQELRVEDIFAEGELVDVIGWAKGKGFAGVVKRHGFSGVGESTHGQHNRQRAIGSLGAGSYPARVWKGQKMAGRMGGQRVKIFDLKVLKVAAEDNLLVVSGSVPGAKNSYVYIVK